MILKPDFSKTPPYFTKYINLITENNLLDAMHNNLNFVQNFYKNIVTEKHNFVYAPGKWTPKQILQHCIDTETVLQYRSLCFTRNGGMEQPTFNENIFAENDNCNYLNMQEILQELALVRNRTIQFVKNNTENNMQKMGTANAVSSNAVQMLWFSLGHFVHHANVVQEKYLI